MTAATDDVLGQPRGLAWLSGTQFFEAFSLYGTQALLTLYMVGQLLTPGHAENVLGLESLRRSIEGVTGPLSTQAFAVQLFGLWAGLIRFTPVFGGFIGDRLLGRSRTIMLGCLTMTAGHFALAFDASFLVGLLLLMLGTGFANANLFAQAGAVYGHDDRRRDDGIQLYYLALNQKKAELANPKVQEAMRWAVDYAGMTDSILKGQWVVHQAFLPEGFLGALTENPYSLDVEKAKALMAESGVTLPLEVGLTVRNNPERLDIATSLQNTFAQVGINLVLDVGDGAQVLEKYRARQHDITIQTWGPDYPDPHTNASTFAMNPDNSDEAGATGYLAWRTAWEPGELHAMTEAAVAEKDTAKRTAMYEEIQRKHRDGSAFVMMFQQARQDAMRANVTGFYAGGATDSASFWIVTK